MGFEWDIQKNASNIKKHGISFEEAKEIFDSPVFTTIVDRQHYGEVREKTIGIIRDCLIIVVIHTDRNGRCRIISARLAKTKERREYYEYIEEET